MNNAGWAETGIDDVTRDAADQLIVNYPNPFVQNTKLTFKAKGGHTLAQIMDTLERVIKVITDKNYVAGIYTLDFDSGGLLTGVCYARLQNGTLQQARPMMKVR